MKSHVHIIFVLLVLDLSAPAAGRAQVMPQRRQPEARYNMLADHAGVPVLRDYYRMGVRFTATVVLQRETRRGCPPWQPDFPSLRLDAEKMRSEGRVSVGAGWFVMQCGMIGYSVMKRNWGDPGGFAREVFRSPVLPKLLTIGGGGVVVVAGIEYMEPGWVSMNYASKKIIIRF